MFSRDPAVGSRYYATLFFCLMALWLFGHPYIGFDYHDTRIYAVLALHWLSPGAYARDPLFMFGSQDSYSLFSPLFGTLIDYLGLPGATKAILLSGALAWIIAAIWLGRILLPWRVAQITAALAMAALMQNYSPNGLSFLLNEPFATARSWAFSLGSLALASCLAGYIRWALGLALAACLLHPLVGIWVICVGFLWKVSFKAGIWIYSLGIAVFVALVFLALGPFNWIEPEWVQFLRDYNDPFVDGTRFERFLFPIAGLLLAARLAEKTASKLYACAALIGASGYFASMLCSQIAPSELFIQAQLWRSMWLVHMLLPFAIAQIFFFLWTLAPSKTNIVLGPWLAVAAMLCLAYAANAHGHMIAVAVILAWFFPMIFVCANRLANDYPIIPKLVVIGMLALYLPMYILHLELLSGSLHVPHFASDSIWQGLFIRGGDGLGFLILAGLILLATRFPAGVLVSIGMLLVALNNWDIRSNQEKEWGRRVADQERGQLGKIIKRGDVVLWDDRMPSRAWFELGTAHYASEVQGIGVVFSQEKANELIRRSNVIREARKGEMAKQGKADLQPQHPFAFVAPGALGARALCQDPALDWFVAPFQSTIEPGVFKVFDETSGRILSVHSCAYYRAGPRV